MVAICRDKNTGKINRVIELSNTKFIQQQLDNLQLNDENYNIDYFIGDIERDTEST